MVTRDDTQQARRRLRELQAEGTPSELSPLVEQRVMTAWDERHQLSEGMVWSRRRVVAAAVVVVAIGTAVARVRWSVNDVPPSSTAKAVLGVDTSAWGQAIPAMYEADPETLQVVLLRADGATLSRLGVPLSDVVSEAPVALEVVLREDGTALSVRVLDSVEEQWP